MVNGNAFCQSIMEKCSILVKVNSGSELCKRETNNETTLSQLLAHPVYKFDAFQMPRLHTNCNRKLIALETMKFWPNETWGNGNPTQVGKTSFSYEKWQTSKPTSLWLASKKLICWKAIRALQWQTKWKSEAMRYRFSDKTESRQMSSLLNFEKFERDWLEYRHQQRGNIKEGWQHVASRDDNLTRQCSFRVPSKSGLNNYSHVAIAL